MVLFKMIWGVYYMFGFVLLVLVVLCVVWGVMNLCICLLYGYGLIGFVLFGGYFVFYVLMIFVFVIGFLWVYGGGRGFFVFGI